MKRRYKLILIIVIGVLITFFINSIKPQDKISLVSIGDGFSIGMTSYGVIGTSFNDYLKESFKKGNNLDYYNEDFSNPDLSIHELNEYLKENKRGNYEKTPIKQIIAKADILTISIGMDELVFKNTKDDIDDYLKEIELFLKSTRKYYKQKIIVIGLYPYKKLNQEKIININNKLSKLCGKYNCLFYDVMALSLKREYYFNEDSYYFNYLAHQEIAKDIYNMIEK